jgi:hypothetical protein
LKLTKWHKACVVPILLCIFLSPLLVHPIEAESHSWAGNWEFQWYAGGNEWYPMTLTQSGATVKGRAPTYMNSTVEATASGTKLEGLIKPGPDWVVGNGAVDGELSLEMSADGNSFEGHLWSTWAEGEYRYSESCWMRGNRTEASGINLLIVPVNLQDQAIRNSKTYYDEIALKLSSYFTEVSYGQLRVKTSVFQTDGEWATLQKTSGQYNQANSRYDFLVDAIDLIDDEVFFNTYDYSDADGKGVVAFVSPTNIAPPGKGACAYIADSQDGKFGTDDGTKIDAIYTYEDRFYGEDKIIRGLAHEFAHVLGKLLVTSVDGASKGGRWSLPDEYLMGDVTSHYSLMGDVTIAEKIEFVHLDSFTKEWLGWLEYSDAEMNMSYSVKQLDSMNYGDSVLLYEHNDPGGVNSGYIFEVRSNSSAPWDSETDYHKSLVLYSLEEKPSDYAGYILNLARVLTQPGSNLSDPNFGIVIKLTSFSEQDAQISIEQFNANNLVGAVASSDGKVLSAASGMVVPEVGFSVLPDVDLHAYANDGKHVGMNYQTGIYENQIEGAIASGDLIGGTEWIFAPENANLRFETSSSDTAQFFQEYPEASSYSNGTETYALKMVYYSPDGSRYESQPTEHEISSGSTINHAYTITSNADGSYSVTTSESGTPSDGTQQTNLPLDPLIIVVIVSVIAIVVGVFLVLRSRKHQKSLPTERQQFPPPPPPPPPPQ